MKKEEVKLYTIKKDDDLFSMLWFFYRDCGKYAYNPNEKEYIEYLDYKERFYKQFEIIEDYKGLQFPTSDFCYITDSNSTYFLTIRGFFVDDIEPKSCRIYCWTEIDPDTGKYVLNLNGEIVISI